MIHLGCYCKQQQYSELQFSHSSCNEGYLNVSLRGCNLCLSSSRLISKGQDKHLGRWSWMHFNSSLGRELLIITADHISQHSLAGLGHETFYMQQWQKIFDLKGDPRSNFWSNLTNFIKASLTNRTWMSWFFVVSDENAD